VFGGNGNDIISTNSSFLVDTIDGGRGIDTVLLQGRDDFDLRQTTNVERVEQAPGNANIRIDEAFFLTADSDTVVIDMGDGGDGGIHVIYDGDLLDFALIAGKIKFGEPGDLDKTLVLDDVEHLWLTDTSDPTGNYVFDHWLV
jgi:hypothetical protein